MDYPFISLVSAISLIALALLFALTAVAVGALVILAALPGRIARARNHPQAVAVSICGWLGLPTGVLWVAALAWSYWSYSSIDMHELDTAVQKIELAIAKLEDQRKSGLA